MDFFKTEKFYPMRPIQRWLVDTHFNKAKSTMMNIGVFLKLSAVADMSRMAEAINHVVNSHDIFRCRFFFHPETSDLCQIFDGEISPVVVEEISDEEFSNRLVKLREPYKIIGKQLWRIYLFQTPTAKYLFADFYHAIMDGVAASYLLAREVELAYQGRAKKLPPASYAQYVEEEANIPPESLAEGHAYWKNMLAPFDEKRHLPPVKVSGVAAWTQGNFSYNIRGVLNEYFRETHVCEDTFFLGATMITLAKITGSKDVIMSRIDNGRTNMHERRMMGLMLSQFPCAWDFSNDMPVQEFLYRLKGQINTGLQYRKSLDVVYNDGLEDDCVSFIFQKDIHADLFLAGGPTEIVYLPPNDISAVENALDVEVDSDELGGYSLYLDYDASRYSADEMENFATTMDKIIRDMRDTTKYVSEILG